LGDAQTPVAYEFAGFRLEPARRALTRPDGTAAHLSGKPFDTLVYLVERAGELVDRDELLHGVWPKRVIEDNNLNQAIATLRRILGEQHVVTVAGRGYQFVTPVRRVPLSAPPTPSEPAPSMTRTVSPPTDPGPTIGSFEADTQRWRLRWPVVAAFAAGLTTVALLALAPPRTTSNSLAEAAVSVQPLTTSPGEELTPALSPDGTRVAFSWREASANREIYVTQVGVTSAIRLSDSGGAQDAFPAWSPDGRWIAFLRHYDPVRFDVMLMPALGGEARPKYKGEMHPISVEGYPLLGWTPDGRQLLFTSLRKTDGAHRSYGLHRLTVDTGEVEDLGLANEPMHYDTSPAVSPDGQWLAFTRYLRTQRLNQIMLQRLGPGFVPVGSPSPLPNLEEDIHHSLHWGPTSDTLWFSNSGRIFESPLDGAARVIHTLGPRYSSPMMSIVPRATGARAAAVVLRADADLFALPVDPVTHRAIGDAVVRAQSSAVEQHPRISPDGKTLAFVSDRSGARDIWLANPDGTNPRQLTRVGQVIVGYPRWSPDSKAIAFHSSAPGEPRVIYRVDVESGATTRLFNGCCPGGWSADGHSLYVTELGDVNYIARVDVATGARRRLVEGETGTESADGQFLLYSKSRERGYFRWPLNSANGSADEERLVEDYTPSSGGVAPVADGFYYIGLTEDSAPRAIRFYSYAHGEAWDVAEVPARTAIGLTVTAEGREVLYAAVGGTPEADILLLDFDHATDD
jgi:Tol biopolymer transport system component/DNA-binding winged helix-turn-helix (wHTH) protein